LIYEYKLVYSGQIDKHLSEGWEPVPNTENVVTHNMNTPMTYVFLRRSR
jgi:hypothetical protein